MRLPSFLACFAGNYPGPSKRRESGGQEQPPAASADLKEITKTYFNLMASADSPRTCAQARVSHRRSQGVGPAAPAARTAETLACTSDATTPSQDRALNANTSSSGEAGIYSAPMSRANVPKHTAISPCNSLPTAAPPPTAQSTHITTTIATTDQQRHTLNATNPTAGLKRSPTQMLYFPTSLQSSLECNSTQLDCSPSTPIARLGPPTPTRHVASPPEQQQQQQRHYHRPQGPNTHLQQPMLEPPGYLYHERQQQQQQHQHQPDASARLHRLHQRLNGIISANRQSYNSVSHVVRIVEDALLAVPEPSGGGGGVVDPKSVCVDTCVARLEGIVQQLEAAVAAAEREWCDGVAAAVLAAQLYNDMYGGSVWLNTQCDNVEGETLGKQGWEVGRRRRLPQAVVVPGQGPAMGGTTSSMPGCAQHHEANPCQHQVQREELFRCPRDQCGQPMSDVRCCCVVQYGKGLPQDKGARYCMEGGDGSWGSRTADDNSGVGTGSAVGWGDEAASQPWHAQQQQQQAWLLQMWVEEQLRRGQEQLWLHGQWRVQQWVEQQGLGMEAGQAAGVQMAAAVGCGRTASVCDGGLGTTKGGVMSAVGLRTQSWT